MSSDPQQRSLIDEADEFQSMAGPKMKPGVRAAQPKSLLDSADQEEYGSRLNRVNERFAEKYKRPITISGLDTPMHRKGNRENFTSDVRTNDLTPAQRRDLIDFGNQEGVKFDDYTDTWKQRGFTGPHMHGQMSESAAPDQPAPSSPPARSRMDGAKVTGSTPMSGASVTATANEPPSDFRQAFKQRRAERQAPRRGATVTAEATPEPTLRQKIGSGLERAGSGLMNIVGGTIADVGAAGQAPGVKGGPPNLLAPVFKKTQELGEGMTRVGEHASEQGKAHGSEGIIGDVEQAAGETGPLLALPGGAPAFGVLDYLKARRQGAGPMEAAGQGILGATSVATGGALASKVPLKGVAGLIAKGGAATAGMELPRMVATGKTPGKEIIPNALLMTGLQAMHGVEPRVASDKSLIKAVESRLENGQPINPRDFDRYHEAVAREFSREQGIPAAKSSPKPSLIDEADATEAAIQKPDSKLSPRARAGVPETARTSEIPEGQPRPEAVREPVNVVSNVQAQEFPIIHSQEAETSQSENKALESQAKEVAGEVVGKAEAAPVTPEIPPDQHHSNYQPRDEGKFAAGTPEYPETDARGAPARRQSAYDKLVALRRESESSLQQASNLSTEETDRVRAKFEQLKQEGRPIKVAVDDYLRQSGLFGRELSPDQENLLRDLAAPQRRAPVKVEQGGLFEEGIKPTVESRIADQDTRRVSGVTGGLFGSQYEAMADQPAKVEAAKPIEPPAALKPVERVERKAPAPEGIQDFGEKIGGARKDTATSTGERGAKPRDSEDPGWRKRFKVSEITSSTKEGEAGKFAIYDTRKNDWSGQPRQIGQLFATKEAAEKGVELAAVARNHDVYMGRPDADGKSTYAIWRKVTDRKRVQVVKEEFPTRDDAMRYMANHAVDIIETKTNFGEEILAKPDRVVRKGTERRTEPATKEMFGRDFGFRGVEFGNWNNQAERQEVMDHAYDGLHDLAELLGVPPKALSLNGDLALAFGARGQGLAGAKAHYEPDYGVINLTKMSGAGSLAHEWFHALDHYLGRQDTKAGSEKIRNERGDLVYPEGTSRTNMATHGFSAGKKVVKNPDGSLASTDIDRSGVRAELRAAYKDVVQTMFSKAEKYVEDTQKAEKFVGGARDSLAEKLQAIRDNPYSGLSKQLDTRYRARKTEPASAEQLAAFDELAAKLVAGEDLKTNFRATDPEARAGSRKFFAGRYTNDTLEAISEIMKTVRGRAGFSSEKGGPLDDIRAEMTRYQQRVDMLKSANEGETKTKGVPTSYAMEAKKIDQGRASDYWTTEHEMAARAFSAYIEDKVAESGNRSDFLSYGADNKFYRMLGVQPFPEGAERQAINGSFDRLFNVLESKETPSGTALYQSDKSKTHEQREMSTIIDDFASEGVRDFKEAAQRFRDEFGPSEEYGDIFQDAWDANKNVKKRGKTTFDDALAPEPPKKRTANDAESLDMVQYIRARGGIDMGSMKGEQKNLRESRLRQPGLFNKNGLSWDDMETDLRGAGYLQDTEGILEALDSAARGEKRFANSADYDDQVDREWKEASRKDFAQNSDHSIMARAVDNPNAEEYKQWNEAFNDALNPRIEPKSEDVEYFKELSRDLGISDETINRLIGGANDSRRAEAARAERDSESARSGTTVPTDAASFKQGLVDHFDYSPEAAETTTNVVDALVTTLSKESGQSRQSLYDKLILGRRRKGADETNGLEQGDSQRIGIFNKDGKLVGTASLSEKSDPAKWVEENYGKGYDFGPLTIKNEDPKQLNQAARGMTEFLKTGHAIIRALQNPNESTAAHEIHHAILPMFMKFAGEGTSETLTRDMSHMSRWMGFKDVSEFNALHEKYVDSTLTGRDLKKYIDGQEKGARGFEKYLRTGKAPTPALEAAFAKFKEWLTNIYQNLKGSPIDVHFTQQQIGIWDRMLGGKGESGPKVTGIKNATVAEERADRGRDPIEQELQRGFGQVLEEGKTLVEDNPYFRESVVADLIANPRAPSDTEDAALAYDRMKLHNEHREGLREMGEAVNRDDSTGVFQAQAKLRAIEEAIDQNDQAAKKAGTESGRSLNARKMMIREDYSLATMIQKAKVAAREQGKEISPALRKVIEDQAEKIADYESKLDAREKYITELESQRAREEQVGNWRAAGRKAPRKSKAALDGDFSRMQDEFARLAGRPTGDQKPGETQPALYQADKISDREGPFTPEMEKLIKDMARNRVEAGARIAEEVNAEVHAVIRQYLPEVEAREVGDVWSGYGKQAKLSKDEIDVALREAKRQQRLLAALEDAQAGESPLRTGLQRDKPSDRVRELTRAVNSEMRKQGLNMPRDPAERWATALEGIKTRLRNSIADRTGRLETGEKPPKRTSTPYDDEARALKVEADALAKTLREIEGPRKITDEERIRNSESAIERSIADLDARIKRGQLSPRQRPSAPWSAKIGELQAQRKVLADTLKDMRDAAKPPRDKDAERLKAYKKSVEKSAAEYQRRLDEGDFTTTKRKPLELDPVAKELAEKRDLVKRQYQKKLEEMRPGKWFRDLSGLRKSWMLSGPSTQAKNILGTGAYQLFDEVARMPAAIADVMMSSITKQRGITGPSPVAMLDSVIAAVKVGGKEAKEIMKQGATSEQMKQHQFGQEISTGIKVVDVASNAVFRFMSASDRVFYNQSLRRNLIDRATAQAKNESRTDKALNVRQRAKDLADKPSPELEASAKHDALVTTFNNSNKLSEAIKRARSTYGAGANFAIDMVMPFDRTPTNVIARILEASPYGYARNAKQIAQAITRHSMSVDQQREFSQTFGRATAGSAIMALGWYMASKGILTGLAPSPSDRKKDKDAGLEPNALKVGSKWLPIGALSPTGNLLTIGAGLYRETHRDKPDLLKSLGTVLQPLADQPLLKGANQLTDLAHDPSRGAAGTVGSFAGSFIPASGLLRDIAKATDPAKKRYPSKELSLKGVKEQVQQNIPIWRKKLPETEPSKGGSSLYRR